jgi:hypothetical protein
MDDERWALSERTRDLLTRAEMERERLAQLRARQMDLIGRMLDGMPALRRNRRRFLAQAIRQMRSCD